MRVLIVSDTHGSHRNLDAVLERVGKIDATHPYGRCGER